MTGKGKGKMTWEMRNEHKIYPSPTLAKCLFFVLIVCMCMPVVHMHVCGHVLGDAHLCACLYVYVCIHPWKPKVATFPDEVHIIYCNRAASCTQRSN